MPLYERATATDFRVAARWADGLSWLPFPEETSRRTSHALVGDGGGVWLFDPLDAPGVDDAIAEFGSVAGVAVLSAYHARDAAAFARRHDVPVSVPRWLPRVEARVDAPLDRFDTRLGDSGFSVRPFGPFPGWSEGIAYRESDATLYVPDSLGTAPPYTVADERLGLYLLFRLVPPKFFLGYRPDRILVGHGTGIEEEATRALETAIGRGRARLPRAIREHGLTQVRAATAALRE